MDDEIPTHGSPSSNRNSHVDPNAPAGGGGRGRFRGQNSPGPTGKKNPSWWPKPEDIARRKREADPRYFEEPERGAREYIEDKEQNVKILVERRDDGMDHWVIETLDGNQVCEGVYDPASAFTGFAAEQCVDKTSDEALKALEHEVKVFDKRMSTAPPGKKEAKREIILIQRHDWLSKVALKRWGDKHAWKHNLKPTEETMQKRRRRGEAYNPDRIYPGDKFEVVGGR